GTDDRCVHDVGDDLPPQRVLRAAADQPDPFAVNTAVAQQVQAVTQAEGHAFEHGATEVGTGEVVAGQAVQAGAGLGQGGYAFAVEEGQHGHAFGTDGRLRHQGVEPVEIQLQQLANGAVGVGQVHGAD